MKSLEGAGTTAVPQYSHKLDSNLENLYQK